MGPKPEPCTIAADDEVFERYLRNDLSEAAREAFELHYLECPQCLDTLATYRALAHELRDNRQAVPDRLRGDAQARGYAPLMWGLAAAAVLVAAVVIERRPIEPPAVPEQAAVTPAPSAPAPAAVPPAVAPEPAMIDRETLVLMARFDPPTYTPPALRSAQTDADATFRRAMVAYSAGDYTSARAALLEAVSADPQSPAANFFLAISNLLQDRTADGMAGLRRTISLGDTAYLEDAHFYLAKSLLGSGDLAGAGRELSATIQMNGDRRDEAASLRGRLRGQ